MREKRNNIADLLKEQGEERAENGANQGLCPTVTELLSDIKGILRTICGLLGVIGGMILGHLIGQLF